MMKILGFDIGITSIGWAFVENGELRDCGVRIFTKAENPKTGDSLAMPRREARSVRRRLARRKGRLETLKRLLAKEWDLCYEDYIAADGELPKAFMGKNLNNPYVLRYEALQRILSKEEFARVVLHIAKHRGYGNKNTKMTKSEESKREQGKILSALATNASAIAHYRTVGEYFYKEFCEVIKNPQGLNTNEHCIQSKVRVLKPIRNKGGEYTNCILQEDLQRELRCIFEYQKGFGFPITQEFQDKILKIAFYQRPLKDFSHLVGKCTFYPDEFRAPKCSLSAVEFITLSKTINVLTYISKESGEVYSKGQYEQMLDSVFNAVCEKGSLSFVQLRKILHIDERIRFKEVDYMARKSKNTSGDSTHKQKTSNPETKKFIEHKNLKKFCEILSEIAGDRALADSIARDITLIKDEEKLAQKLRGYGKFSQEQITQLSALDFSHHINLSLKALSEILPFMREGMRYDEACKLAGLKARHNDKKSKFLPPFCESIYADELTNPVVHRAIAEYRKILNALIAKYGSVHKIHIELTRDVGKNFQEREKYKKEIESNYKARVQAMQECEKLGLTLSEGNILKLRLFREQNEICVYSGRKITLANLKEQGALEIDHILPYSRSSDDSYMNKVLVFTNENQNKGNKTPYEAFGGDSQKWGEIESLALRSGYPKKKAKRILDKGFGDREAGFKSRNIVDSGYIARLIANYTKEYLKFLPLDSHENTALIAGEKDSKIHVEAVKGMLTATMRHFWGLGSKNRYEHTHHAIDAIIIAYINAAMIQRFSQFRQNQESLKARFYAKELAKEEFKTQRAFFEPFSGFREQVLAKVGQIFVSRPPRKRARGALHEETFYSIDDKKLSETYGGKKGVQRALSLGKIRQIGTKIMANGPMVRVDIFKHKQSGRFYAVPIYTMDFALGILPNKAVVSGKDNDRIIKDWLEMDSCYEFCFSLFKDDLIEVQKRDMEKPELAYFVSLDASDGRIKVRHHCNDITKINENQKNLFSEAIEKEVVGRGSIQNLKVFKKYKVSPLGEIKEAKYEPRQPIALKTSPKKHRKQNNAQ
ncbi:type II CRISPR RNA-guided endonuclease Cas9 [Helicobacter pullorum]|uniref:type II CRISPR RNA-guided endonuclease Cas9 n=1 Tax=Helicobacter pullorum TaxID=35818 RepID=UPI0013156DEF|nr:type II CRISPR RNA-guided endonuclease Cas9 [Helicobacter pullorum]